MKSCIPFQHLQSIEKLLPSPVEPLLDPRAYIEKHAHPGETWEQAEQRLGRGAHV
jgi:hypothetical protein